MAAFLLDAPCENLIDDAMQAIEALGEEVLETAGEMQHRLVRRRLVLDQRGIARPADFHSAEKIGLGARHLVEPGREKIGVALAEDLLIRVEGDFGAAPAGDLAEVCEFAGGFAALEFLAVELLTARHLDDHMIGQRIHHRNADAMQPARGFIGA